MEFWKLEKDTDGTLRMFFKKSVEDIDGKIVTIPAETKDIDLAKLNSTKEYWLAQKGNCDFQIAQIDKQIIETEKYLASI